MIVSYKENKQFPSLAWGASVCENKIEIIHGNHVECTDDFFVEGAWDGEFKDGLFTNANWFCGTGAEIKKNEIIFSTPSHVTYGLYMYKNNQTICISNSLYLLMALNGLEMDSEYAKYEIDFNSIRKGVDNYKRTIRTIKEGRVVEVNVIYYSNLVIDVEGNLNIERKQTSSTFVNYEDYYKRLVKSMVLLKNNACNESRKKRYGVVTTISKGYDAPCCAVIGKKMGAITACTFEAKGKHENDCGFDIARKLGYTNIIVRNHNEYKNNKKMVEAEVVCTGELGSEISMASFYDVFKGNIVLTGERGDFIWDRNADNVNSDFRFDSRDASLGSSERRLWVDYISCPMPLFGATAWESIRDISNSQEMEKWSLHNDYDRPIPRRIVEEAGISREEFGMKKQGAGFSYSYDWKSRIIKRMSEKTGKNFNDYLKKNKKNHLFSSLVFYFKVRKIYLSRIGLCKRPTKDFSEIENTTIVRYLVPWAGEHIIKRYKNALIGYKEF